MSQSGTDNPLPQRPEHHRLPTLDLLRGLAVLGIVAINVAGFTGPKLATLTPSLLTPAGPQPASPVDESAFALLFLLVEGKMRALFTMLFGASMLLFIERMEAAGRHGMLLQARRLLWLGLFGYLHYILLWWGDVLFVYALCGLIALAFAQWPPRMLLLIGGMGFVGWALLGGLGDLPLLLAEEQARLGAQASTDVLQGWRESSEAAMQDSAQAMLGFWPMAADKLRHAPFWPLVMAFASMGETLPLMLLGMALYRLGFWQGQWNRRSLWMTTLVGLVIGGAMAGGLLFWAWPRHFPALAMPSILAYWAGPEHLLLALAYAALLLLAAPRLMGHALGQRLMAAGRMAFSNYIATTISLTALFYGWGAGLFGRIGHAQQLWLVLGVWAAMLAWSKPWLAHFRQGPLEWLWRSLVEFRALPFRKNP